MKKWAANHPREYVSVFANLEDLLYNLGGGRAIEHVTVGFLRSEGGGVYRIGQTGIKGAKETRLYIAADAASATLYVLGIGGKESQQRDIGSARDLAAKLRR